MLSLRIRTTRVGGIKWALIALSAAFGGLSIMAAPPTTSVSEVDIRRMLNDWPSLLEVADILDAASASGNPALIPPLKEAVEVLAIDPKRAQSVSGPLEALWRLGVEREYFVDKVRRYKDSRWMAGYCIRILARHPEAEFAPVLEQIAVDDRMTPSSPLGWAIMIYRKSLEAAQAYERLTDVNARLEFLCQYASAWHPIGGDVPAHVIPLDSPELAWARPRLLELSRQHPGAAAQALLRLDTFEDWGSNANRLWRESVAQFLGADARSRFEQLSREGAGATRPTTRDGR